MSGEKHAAMDSAKCDGDIGFVFARNLSPDFRVDAAVLVEMAAPDFYGLFPFDADERWSLVSELFDIEHSGLRNCRAALSNGRIAGIQAGMPASQYHRCQLVSAVHFLQRLDLGRRNRARVGMERFRAQVPDPPEGSHYLARFAVAVADRRRGIASRLLDDFRAGAAGASLSLHVHRENADAIAFYLRHGFRISADAAHREYLLMTDRV